MNFHEISAFFAPVWFGGSVDRDHVVFPLDRLAARVDLRAPSSSVAADVVVVGISVMPQRGQVAAQEAVISACIGQANGIDVSVSGLAGTSVIPHLGHVAANDAAISACIGHTW